LRCGARSGARGGSTRHRDRPSLTADDVRYALSTLAQTCAALAAFVGAVGIFRLQILRDQRQEMEFEYRARVRGATGHETHAVSIGRVFELDRSIPEADVEKRKYVAEARDMWQDAEPHMRRTIYTRVIFEAWILLVILISLGGLAHVPALEACPLSSVVLWFIAILTVLTTAGALFVWLDVRRWWRRSSNLTMTNPKP
jgi:hypothetical protein